MGSITPPQHRDKRLGVAERIAMGLLSGRLLTLSEHRDTLAAAGYSNVEVFEERRRGWMCAVGKKSTFPPHGWIELPALRVVANHL